MSAPAPTYGEWFYKEAAPRNPAGKFHGPWILVLLKTGEHLQVRFGPVNFHKDSPSGKPKSPALVGGWMSVQGRVVSFDEWDRWTPLPDAPKWTNPHLSVTRA